MRRIISVMAILLAFLMVFSSCSPGRLSGGEENSGSSRRSSKNRSNDSGDDEDRAVNRDEGNNSNQDEGQKNNKDEGKNEGSGHSSEVECDWTIRVNDSEKGELKIPNMGSAKATVTLDLVAFKDGGKDVNGEYEGEGYLTIDLDLSGFSNAEYLYQGFANWNRYCESFKVKIEGFDSERYNQKTPAMRGGLTVQPLKEWNAMGISMSSWDSMLKHQTTITDRDSGGSGSAGGSGSDDFVTLGVSLRIEGASVVLEIPTYSYTFEGVTYFKGTITGEPLGSRKKDKLPEPPLPAYSQEGYQYSPNNEGDDEQPEPDNDEDEPGGMYQDENGMHVDSDGDGIYEIFIDKEGNTHMDTDGDGVMDTVMEGEYGEG